MENIAKDSEIMRGDKGRFLPGKAPKSPGRPKETTEQIIIKKAVKELVKEYEEDLAEVLPELAPVLKKKALEGDIQHIKELHDVIGLKRRGEGNTIAIQVNVNEDRDKYK